MQHTTLLTILLLVGCSDLSFAQPIPGDVDPKAEVRQMTQQYMQDLNAQRSINNPALTKTLALLPTHGAIFDGLELLEYQRTDISALRREYEPKISTLEQGDLSPDDEQGKQNRRQLVMLRHDYRKKLVDILLPHQLDMLLNCNVDAIGLPKLVTRSLMSKALDLTDQQKKAIESKSEALAREIEAFIHDTRRKASRIVMDELNMEQRAKLNDLIGEDALIRHSSRIPITSIFKQYLYSWDQPKRNPIERIVNTDLTDK